MSAPSRISLKDIVPLLGALGEAKAQDVLRQAAATLEIRKKELEPSEVLQVLEEIASFPGLIGITARFAKARAILRWPVR